MKSIFGVCFFSPDFVVRFMYMGLMNYLHEELNDLFTNDVGVNLIGKLDVFTNEKYFSILFRILYIFSL